MRLEATILIVAMPLVAVGIARAQGSCVRCISTEYCTIASPNGYCACFFGDYGRQGSGLCKSGTCTSQVPNVASCAKAAGPDFATDKRMRKALVDGVDAYSHTLVHLIDMLLPKIAEGTTVAGGYVGTKDHTEKTETSFSVKNGEFIFTVGHPVSPDASDAPTRLVLRGHTWTLYRDSSEVASGSLSDYSVE
jgi:hypothetical protein